jgi:hypothetical protein
MATNIAKKLKMQRDSPFCLVESGILPVNVFNNESKQ